MRKLIKNFGLLLFMGVIFTKAPISLDLINKIEKLRDPNLKRMNPSRLGPNAIQYMSKITEANDLQKVVKSSTLIPFANESAKNHRLVIDSISAYDLSLHYENDDLKSDTYSFKIQCYKLMEMDSNHPDDKYARPLKVVFTLIPYDTKLKFYPTQIICTVKYETDTTKSRPAVLFKDILEQRSLVKGNEMKNLLEYLEEDSVKYKDNRLNLYFNKEARDEAKKKAKNARSENIEIRSSNVADSDSDFHSRSDFNFIYDYSLNRGVIPGTLMLDSIVYTLGYDYNRSKFINMIYPIIGPTYGDEITLDVNNCTVSGESACLNLSLCGGVLSNENIDDIMPYDKNLLFIYYKDIENEVQFVSKVANKAHYDIEMAEKNKNLNKKTKTTCGC